MARKLNPTEQAQLDRMAGRTSLKAILTGLLASFTMHARYAATEEAKEAYQEQAAAVTLAMQRARVLISVNGGVAEFEAVGPVEVDMVDFDNLESEGKSSRERDAEYSKMKRWLITGKLED